MASWASCAPSFAFQRRGFGERQVLCLRKAVNLGDCFSPGEPKARGEFTLPLTKRRVALLPIVPLGGGELLGVIALCLARVQGFGDGQHSAG